MQATLASPAEVIAATIAQPAQSSPVLGGYTRLTPVGQRTGGCLRQYWN